MAGIYDIIYGIKVNFNDSEAMKALKNLEKTTKESAKKASDYIKERMAVNNQVLKGLGKDNAKYWDIVKTNAGLYMQRLVESGKLTEKELADIGKRWSEALALQQSKANEDKYMAHQRLKAEMALKIEKDKLKSMSKDEEKYWDLRRRLAEQEVYLKKGLNEQERINALKRINANIDAERIAYDKSKDKSAEIARQKAQYELKLQKDKLTTMSKDDADYWRLKQEIMYKELEMKGLFSAKELQIHKDRIARDIAAEKQMYNEKMSLTARFNNQIMNIAQRALTYLSIYRVIGAINTTIRDWVNNMLDLEFAFAKVKTISTVVFSQYERVRALSKEVGKSSVDLANSLYEINSAGQYGAEGMKVLEVAARAAIAGFTTVEDAGDTITDVLNAYELSAAKSEYVTDILLKAVEIGKFKWEEYHGVLGRIMPLANNVGISLEDLMGTVALLSKKGLVLSESITGLRGILSSALKPSNAMKKALDEMAKSTGVFHADAAAAIRSMGLINFLTELQKVAESSGEDFAKFVNRIQGFNAVLSVLGKDGSGKETLDSIGAMYDATGTLIKQESEMANTMQFRINKMKQAWADFGLTMTHMAAPIFEKVLNLLNKIIDLMARFPVLTLGFSIFLTTGIIVKVLALLGVVAKLKVAFLALSAVITGKAVLSFRLLWAAMNPVAMVAGLIIAAISIIIAKKGEMTEQDRVSKLRQEESSKALLDYHKKLQMASSALETARIKKEQLDASMQGKIYDTDQIDSLIEKYKGMVITPSNQEQPKPIGAPLTAEIAAAWNKQATDASIKEFNRLASETKRIQGEINIAEKEFARESLINLYRMNDEKEKGWTESQSLMYSLLSPDRKVYFAVEDFMALSDDVFEYLNKELRKTSDSTGRASGLASSLIAKLNEAITLKNKAETDRIRKDASLAEEERIRQLEKLNKDYVEWENDLYIDKAVADLKQQKEDAIAELAVHSAAIRDKRELSEQELKAIKEFEDKKNYAAAQAIRDRVDRENKIITEHKALITNKMLEQRETDLKRAKDYYDAKIMLAKAEAELKKMEAEKELSDPKKTLLEKENEIADKQLEIKKIQLKIDFYAQKDYLERVTKLWEEHFAEMEQIRTLEFEIKDLEAMAKLKKSEEAKITYQKQIIQKQLDIDKIKYGIQFKNATDLQEKLTLLEEDAKARTDDLDKDYLLKKINFLKEMTSKEEGSFIYKWELLDREQAAKEQALKNEYELDTKYYDKALAALKAHFDQRRKETIDGLMDERAKYLSYIPMGEYFVSKEKYSQELENATAYYDGLKTLIIENKAYEEAIDIEKKAVLTGMQEEFDRKNKENMIKAWEESSDTFLGIQMQTYSQAIDLLQSNLEQSLNMIIDKGKTGSEKWKEIWENMYTSAYNFIVKLFASWVAEQVKAHFASISANSQAAVAAVAAAAAIKAAWYSTAVIVNTATMGLAAIVGLAGVKAAEMAGTATAATAALPVDDFISVGGKMYQFRKDDLVIGGTNLGGKSDVLQTPHSDSEYRFDSLEKRMEGVIRAVRDGNMILQQKEMSVALDPITGEKVNILNIQGERKNRIVR